jgi:hemerythrin-like metal-binding protein
MIPLYINWSKKLNLGITIIDEQHRGLVSIINSFHYHKSDEVVDRVLTPTVDILFSFFRIHFMTEENMMEQAGYPGFEDHRQNHLDSFAELEKIRYECRQDNDPERFTQFLRDYWTRHVNDYDRGYVSTLHEYFD